MGMIPVQKVDSWHAFSNHIKKSKMCLKLTEILSKYMRLTRIHRKEKSKLFFKNHKLCDLRRIHDLLLKYVLRHTLLFIISIVAITYYIQLFSKLSILKTDSYV